MPPARHRRVFAAFGFAAALGTAFAGALQSQGQVPRELAGAAGVEDDSKPIPIEKGIRFSLRGDDLIVSTELKLTDGARQVKLIGLDGSTVIESGRRRGPMWFANSLELRHSSAGGDDVGTALSQTRVFVQGSNIRIERTFVTGDVSTNVYLGQDNFNFRRNRNFQPPTPPGDRVVLRVNKARIDQRSPEETRVSANSFAELLRKDPDQTLRYLAPVFREFAQDARLFDVDPCVAWQVFPDALPSDRETESKSVELLGKLDALDFRVRDRATKALESLGGPAVHALAAVSRAPLSAEQNARVDAFLAKYHPLDASEAVALADNPAFLLRCFVYCDVEPIRAAAAKALAGKLGDPIKLDPAAKQADRVVAMEKAIEKVPEQP